jgi:predicted RNase H-like HicB family nuclease
MVKTIINSKEHKYNDGIMTRYMIITTKGEIAYVSYCQELGIASQGKTVKEAMKNIKEAISLYLEEAKDSKVAKSRLPIVTTLNVSAVG